MKTNRKKDYLLAKEIKEKGNFAAGLSSGSFIAPFSSMLWFNCFWFSFNTFLAAVGGYSGLKKPKTIMYTASPTLNERQPD